MTFWVVTILMSVMALGLILWAAVRARAEAEPAAAYDLRVYRQQLEEVDRDVARGVLQPDDADRVRVEVSRRILAADAALKEAGQTARASASAVALLAGLSVAVAGGIFALYLTIGAPGYGDQALAERIAAADAARENRPSQVQAESTLKVTPDEGANPEYLNLVKQLRVALEERPDDERGYRLLAQAEARLGNMKAAYTAQERVLELTGGQEAALEDWTGYADMLILAAGGYVSPQAEQALNVILTRDRGNGIARYYWGLMQIQTGRPDRAFRVWDALLREGPPEAPWIPPILEQINETAALAGVRYDVPPIGEARGPTAEDVEAAQDMSPAERMEMIEGMVSGLAARLAEEGGPPQDWARLISALGVLGQRDQAAQIFAEAKALFGDNPGAMDAINRAAERAGLL